MHLWIPTPCQSSNRRLPHCVLRSHAIKEYRSRLHKALPPAQALTVAPRSLPLPVMHSHLVLSRPNCPMLEPDLLLHRMPRLNQSTQRRTQTSLSLSISRTCLQSTSTTLDPQTMHTHVHLISPRCLFPQCSQRTINPSNISPHLQHIDSSIQCICGPFLPRSDHFPNPQSRLTAASCMIRASMFTKHMLLSLHVNQHLPEAQCTILLCITRTLASARHLCLFAV